MSRVTRRDFLKGAVAGTAGAVLLGQDAYAASSKSTAGPKSTVAVVTSPRIFVDSSKNPNTPSKLGMTSVGEYDDSIDQEVLNSMVFAGVRAFTGEKSDAAAWKKLFKPDDIVGIKVNSLFGRGLSTRPEVVASIIAGLLLAGVKPDNIIVYDRMQHELQNAGFILNIDGPGVKVKGTQPDGYEKGIVQGEYTGPVSKILLHEITALVNAPFLKDHGGDGSTGAGVTCAMKNHFGSIDNPGDYHYNNCDPGIADVNCIPAIKNKTRLIVADALRPLCNGGPGRSPDYTKYVWDHRTLLIGADSVAVDYLGWQIIDSRRKILGLNTLAENGSEPKYIASAARRGLGTNDPARIRIVRKTIV